jgi:hypothetical protein
VSEGLEVLLLLFIVFCSWGGGGGGGGRVGGGGWGVVVVVVIAVVVVVYVNFLSQVPYSININYNTLLLLLHGSTKQNVFYTPHTNINVIKCTTSFLVLKN